MCDDNDGGDVGELDEFERMLEQRARTLMTKYRLMREIVPENKQVDETVIPANEEGIEYSVAALAPPVTLLAVVNFVVEKLEQGWTFVDKATWGNNLVSSSILILQRKRKKESHDG